MHLTLMDNYLAILFALEDLCHFLLIRTRKNIIEIPDLNTERLCNFLVILRDFRQNRVKRNTYINRRICSVLTEIHGTATTPTDPHSADVFVSFVPAQVFNDGLDFGVL